MTDSYNQTSINLGAAAAGGALNVISVPFTSIQGSGPTGPVYYVQLGAPVDLYGDRASDWFVTPGVPGSSSATLQSNIRDAPFWTAASFTQQGPSAGIPRAFFSAFHDGVGVTGGSASFSGNNWRVEFSLSWGGLLAGEELSFRFSWNGNTPLTLNPGSNIILFST